MTDLERVTKLAEDCGAVVIENDGDVGCYKGEIFFSNRIELLAYTQKVEQAYLRQCRTVELTTASGTH